MAGNYRKARNFAKTATQAGAKGEADKAECLMDHAEDLDPEIVSEIEEDTELRTEKRLPGKPTPSAHVAPKTRTSKLRP